jgi:hypothetical protein
MIKWGQFRLAKSPASCSALARVAEDRGYADLADVFRGTPRSWQFAQSLLALILGDLHRIFGDGKGRTSNAD